MTAERWASLLLSIGIFAGVAGVAFVLRRLLFRSLRAWAQRTATRLDDLLLEAIRIPSLYWIVVLALYVALGSSDLPERYLTYAFKALEVLLIVSVTLVAANLAARAFAYSIERLEITVPITGLSTTIIKTAVITVGALILLNNLGISITPLLTALGVGGLAVALGLQDTLANLFAGIHILLERPVRVGDFIRLETGQEGYVVDIGWRTTRIRMLPNNMVIIPNSKLVQSIVTNYYLPEKRMSLLIPISVSYDADPEHVERVLIEEATRAAGDIPGLLADPPPFVRFIPGFGDFSLDFTLICQVQEFVDQYLAQHELRKRIFKRFKAEGIEIPFPIRTVYLRPSASDAPSSQGGAP